MKLASILSLLVLGNTLLLADTCDKPPVVRTLADQPEAQRKAVKKILKLGGDWELGSKTVLIGFIGDNFTNQTFSLLEPLTDIKHLAFFHVPADDSAFKHCKNLKNVEWLQFSSCNFNGTGLLHLLNCKKLRHIYIEDTPLTDKALEILAKFPSIETISIDYTDLPSRITKTGVRKLATLKNAKQIHIDITEDPADLETEMKALLPLCEFSFYHNQVQRESIP